MKRPDRHICIATGQNLANLIPAIQLGAQEVIILETKEMLTSAKNLQAALKSRGINVKRVTFDDSSPETIVAMSQSIALELGENPLILNATGGHKLMTLALNHEMQELAGDNLHVLYCETRNNRIDWLQPDASTQLMADILKLEDVLLVQGFRLISRSDRDVKWMNDAESRSSLTRSLGDDADKLARFFGTLNWLADQALNEPKGPFRPQQDFDFTPGGRNADLLREAENLQLIRWDGNTEIVFAHSEAAQYFRGGWLEEYAWLKLRGLKPHDFATNLRVETISEHSPNEFDVVLVHRNRLLNIECKTKRLGRDSGVDANYIYKLGQLTQNVGGLMGRSLFLSARSVTDEFRGRAKENKVDVLAGKEIKDLVEYLKNWMEK